MSTGRLDQENETVEGGLVVSGSYSFIGDDGQLYTIQYTADANGFQPMGDHLPTSPPIPDAILQSLQLTAGSEGVYICINFRNS